MTTDDQSFKSRADIASNICSFFIISQVRSTKENNEKPYAAKKARCDEFYPEHSRRKEHWAF